jgi:hypothetical protein
MTLRIGTTARNAQADAVAAMLNGGTVEVRTGAQPADPQTTASGTLLATIPLAATAYGAASAGVAALAGTPRTDPGDAAGTAGWWRAKSSGGVAILDGACGTSGSEMNLNSLSIAVGVDVSITSGSITAPAA